MISIIIIMFNESSPVIVLVPHNRKCIRRIHRMHTRPSIVRSANSMNPMAMVMILRWPHFSLPNELSFFGRPKFNAIEQSVCVFRLSNNVRSGLMIKFRFSFPSHHAQQLNKYDANIIFIIMMVDTSAINLLSSFNWPTTTKIVQIKSRKTDLKKNQNSETIKRHENDILNVI